jgi:hypothetical protein
MDRTSSLPALRASRPQVRGRLLVLTLLLAIPVGPRVSGQTQPLAGDASAPRMATQRFRIHDDQIEILETTLPATPDGELAWMVLEYLCQGIGPRISGSEGMRRQQQMLKQHFSNLGGSVEFQSFEVLHPVNRTSVELNNLIARWHPRRQHRVLICCHYDTRPFPDRDPNNPTGVFLGANDGASGVGLLCELARYLPGLQSEFGVDLVCFDGEEFVYQTRRDPLFLGSTHFAREYAAHPPAVRYSAGVLVDMIGDRDLTLFQEKNSWQHAQTITRQIWDVAANLGIEEFIPRRKYEIRDDHLPLNEIAGIPTCDIIDFDYPKGRANVYWHTEQDTPDKCSAASLAKVGTVLVEWLKIIRSPR